jgi:hypothetical protein
VDQNDELKDQVGGVVERHGDEVVEEMVKTVRTVRRISIGMLFVFGVVFLSALGFIVWAVSHMASP